MVDEKKKTQGITIEAVQPHTYRGESYDIGDTYDVVDEATAESIVAQGKGRRADAHTAKAPAAKAPAAKPKGKK
jgi:hypothetical protein